MALEMLIICRNKTAAEKQTVSNPWSPEEVAE